MITHLACVMDGNRRWAKRQGQLPWNGHRAGVQTVETVINFCLQHNIAYLSLYTFSLENFKRSQEEKSYLFDLVVQQAQNYVDRFIQENIAIQFIGNLEQFPEHVRKICIDVQEKTKQGARLQVNFLFGYGAQQEIFFAAKKLAEQIILGKNVTQEDFEAHLWTGSTPFPDVIIRTGGVQRLSNFLLYQSAYAEIRFLDTLWPDLTEQQIFEVVTSAVQAQKNLGK